MAETNRKETKKQRHRDIGRKTGMNNTQKQRQTEGEKQETGPQRQKRSESGNSQRRREGNSRDSVPAPAWCPQSQALRPMFRHSCSQPQLHGLKPHSPRRIYPGEVSYL